MKIPKINSHNGKNLNLLAVDKNDQSSNLGIHSYRVIYLFESGNTSAHNPCLQANTVNASLYNSLVMNAGGVA